MDNTKKPHFDAAGYLESQGLTFKGFDKATGHALVENDESGERGTFDVKSLLKKEGLNPDADVTFNTPDNPLNETPVGTLDRLKLSLGNTKGAVGYLKSKFQDARVDDAGSLVVKDGGAWKKVDLDGLGDDEGWKVSEILGDIADVGGDVLVGTGSAIGAGAALPVGAALSVLSPLVGGSFVAAGAAAGSGGASAIKGVLGRMAGTYDATPEEFVKDVMIDTALGLGGEAVMIGGKHLLGPTLKKGFANLAKMDEGVHDVIAKSLAATDGEYGAGTWRTAVTEPEVVTLVERAATRAAEEVTGLGVNASAPGAASETLTTAIGRTLTEDAVAAAKPLVKETQTNLSNWFGGEIKTIIKETLDSSAFQEIKTRLPQYGKDMISELDGLFAEAGLKRETNEAVKNVVKNASSVVARNGGEPVKSTVSSTVNSAAKTTVQKELVTPKSLAAWAKNLKSASANPAQFGPLAKSMNEMYALAHKLAKGVTNPDELTNLMQMSKKAGDAFEEALSRLPRDQREILEPILQKRLKNIDTAVKNMLPEKFQARYEGTRASYRELSSNVRKVVGALDAKNSTQVWDDAAASVLKHFKATQFEAANPDLIQSHNILKALETITPGGGAHIRNLQLQTAAMAVGGTSIAPALSRSGAIERALTAGAKNLVLKTGQNFAKLQRRANLRGFLQSEPGKQFMAATRTLKAGGKRVAQKPELVAAGLTTALSALRQR